MEIFNKWIKDRIDFVVYLIAKVFFVIFKNYVPYKLASYLGYCFGKFLAKLPLERKKYVLENIAMCFPEYDEKKIKQIYKNVCENFIRNIFEFTKFDYLRKNVDKYISVKDDFGFFDDKKFLIFTAHYGNWELIGMPFLNYTNLYGVYKAPKNKYMSKFFQKIRMQDENNNYKMLDGNARNLLYINALFSNKKNTKFAMLIDQKIYEGVNLLFFNRLAKTSTFLAKIAIKYDLPLVPMRVIRNNDKYTFTIEISKEIDKKDVNGNKDSAEMLTQKMNFIIERWVKEYPEQWFFLHKRWG